MFDMLPQQKALPHSEESERAVLGAILLDYRLLEDVAARLRTDELYSERHKLIYEAMKAVEAPDLRILQAELERRDQFERVGGLAYLSGLDMDLPDIGRLDQYVDIIKERAARRQGIQIAGEIMRGCFDGSQVFVSDTLGKAMTDIDAVMAGKNIGGGFRHFSEWGDAFLTSVTEDEDKEVPGVKIGIPGVDRLIGAMQPGHMWACAARPRMGKTVLLLQVCRREAFQVRNTVGLISLEMSAAELQERMCAMATGIPYGRIKRRRVTQEEITRIIHWRRTQDKAPLFIEEQAGLNVSEICWRIRRLHRQHPNLSLIGLDYLTLVVREGSGRGREDLQIEYLCRTLRDLGKILGVTLFIACQLNRTPERNPDDPPNLSDLKDGGEAEFYGAMFLHRLRKSEDKTQLSEFGSIGILKHRGGPEGRVEARLAADEMVWKEIDTHHEPPPEPRETREWFA
jgi:replicative DNA helicase